MNKNQQDLKRNLEEQLKWTKNQMFILDKMDHKLQEMKMIAEYAAKHNLSAIEGERLNEKLNALKGEYDNLNKQYHSVH